MEKKIYQIEFFDDSKSPDLEKRRVGSHFWIIADDSDGDSRLSFYKDNWGTRADHFVSEDGYVETVRAVKGNDLKRLMQLCDNAATVEQTADYLYKRFSPDGYKAYSHILDWLEENHILTSFWSWP